MWSISDPYTRRVNQEDLEVALDYYIEDKCNCCPPSPYKKDVVGIMCGKKEYIAKCAMCRICEDYFVFKEAHQDTGIGRTKFYSL